MHLEITFKWLMGQLKIHTSGSLNLLQIYWLECCIISAALVLSGSTFRTGISFAHVAASVLVLVLALILTMGSAIILDTFLVICDSGSCSNFCSCM